MNPNGAAADAKGQAEMSIEQWQQRCAELTAERDKLRQKLTQMKQNYEIVRNSLAVLIEREVELEDEELPIIRVSESEVKS